MDTPRTFTLIPAAAADIGQLAPLFDAYRVFYQQPSDLAAARAYLTDRLSAGDSTVFMAVDSRGAGLGFVQLYPTFSSVSMRAVWVLYDLYVRPEARRQGIGRALMERAHQHARETGAGSISLATAVDNLPGQALYESLGYQRDDEFFYYDLPLG